MHRHTEIAVTDAPNFDFLFIEFAHVDQGDVNLFVPTEAIDRPVELMVARPYL